MTAMIRIGAIFIGTCIVLIAASIGVVLYLGFAFDVTQAALVALAVLVTMGLYNTISSRLADRAAVGNQIADLSRGTADLARQVAELGRQLNAMEGRLAKVVDRAHDTVEPVSREIGELGVLVRQVAETVAAHAVALEQQGAVPTPAIAPKAMPVERAGMFELSETEAVGVGRRFHGMSREAIADLVAQATDANRIDLYLQPIVTLPQRKVRYYEALSRLRTESGEIVPAVDFIDIADSVGLTPKIDNLLAFRCVQVMRRLQLKSRDVGLFCNIGAAMLTDPTYFKQFADFMAANRALASSLVFEFSQSTYREFGPLEQESLAALAENGFRFSLDHVVDLRIEPRELADHWFRYMKVPAKLLLDRVAGAKTDIHPEDLADLLARSGIDLIAERIESEGTVVDLLDYDVRFGQGFLFSPPRPVRAEALQVPAVRDAPVGAAGLTTADAAG
jgi:cyclic-di-GMP phosphodiesterase TipF (flagellum assembly factor)